MQKGFILQMSRATILHLPTQLCYMVLLDRFVRTESQGIKNGVHL